MKDTPEAAQRLRNAVALCYEAFRGYHSQPNWVDAMVSGIAFCPSKSPREFSPAEVDDHYSHATYFHGKWQKPNQLQATKFFLPRMVDLLSEPDCRPDGIVFDWWWLGRQWRETNWWDWPSEEYNALREWIEAWWFAVLNFDISDELTEGRLHISRNRAPENVLSIALRGKNDPLQFLAKWEKTESEAATWHLAQLVVDHEESLQTGSIGLPVDFTEQERAQCASWLMRPVVRQRLEDAFFNPARPAMQSWAAQGVEAFDRICQARAILGN